MPDTAWKQAAPLESCDMRSLSGGKWLPSFTHPNSFILCQRANGSRPSLAEQEYWSLNSPAKQY